MGFDMKTIPKIGGKRKAYFPFSHNTFKSLPSDVLQFCVKWRVHILPHSDSSVINSYKKKKKKLKRGKIRIY